MRLGIRPTFCKHDNGVNITSTGVQLRLMGSACETLIKNSDNTQCKKTNKHATVD